VTFLPAASAGIFAKLDKSTEIRYNKALFIYGNTAQNPPDSFTRNLLAVLPLGNTAQRASGDFAFIFF